MPKKTRQQRNRAARAPAPNRPVEVKIPLAELDNFAELLTTCDDSSTFDGLEEGDVVECAIGEALTVTCTSPTSRREIVCEGSMVSLSPLEARLLMTRVGIQHAGGQPDAWQPLGALGNRVEYKLTEHAAYVRVRPSPVLPKPKPPPQERKAPAKAQKAPIKGKKRRRKGPPLSDAQLAQLGTVVANWMIGLAYEPDLGFRVRDYYGGPPMKVVPSGFGAKYKLNPEQARFLRLSRLGPAMRTRYAEDGHPLGDMVARGRRTHICERVFLARAVDNEIWILPITQDAWRPAFIEALEGRLTEHAAHVRARIPLTGDVLDLS